MSMNVFQIIMLAVLSGILNGSYVVPVKLMKNWAWENTWSCFAISGLFIIPWCFALYFIPDVGGILSSSSVKTIVTVFLFGLGWGIGAIAFVMALRLIGFSLGYTLMMGLIAVIGALVPLLVQNPSAFLTPGGKIILLSLMVTVVGILFCGSAGKTREISNQTESSQTTLNKSNFTKGLILCFVSGLFSSMLNFSFEFGAPLSDLAITQLGSEANAFQANSIIWAIALSGGFVAFLGYSFYLFAKNNTAYKFFDKNTLFNFFLAFSMGFIFYGSVLCYGWAAFALGEAGTTIGWVIFTAGAIITANIWGLLSSEWKGVPMRAINKMVLGTIMLIGAVVLVSYGNSLLY